MKIGPWEDDFMDTLEKLKLYKPKHDLMFASYGRPDKLLMSPQMLKDFTKAFGKKPSKK